MSVGLVRYTRAVPDSVRELLMTSAAIDKLGHRGIGVAEAEQLFKNAHRIAPNPGGRSDWPARRLLIGRTNGGRYLTLVVEETIEPTTWLIVTGWDSSESERKILPSE